MPLLTTIALGANLAFKGGRALGLFGGAKKPPKYRKSPQELAAEKLLKKRAEMGLTPGERFAQLNVATTATGGYAEAAKRRIEGRAEFSGIPDLVQREQQKTIDVAATSAISAASRKITGESEAIKRQAEGKLLETAQRTSELEYRSAMARYGAGEQERQARLGAAGEFFGALPGLADQITNMSDKKEFEGMFSGTKDDPNADLSESQRSRLFTIISGSKNPDAMLKQLLQFGIVL